MTESPRVAVVGVGNPIMGDDAVGKHVVDALHDRSLPDELSVAHAGTTAFLALEALSGAELGVVVDAIETGAAPPGSVHRYRLVDGAFDGEPPDVFMHDFSFTEAISVGHDTYDIPPEVVVIGVEPADTTPGLKLSDPVARALDDIVETVLEVAGADPAPDRTDARTQPNP